MADRSWRTDALLLVIILIWGLNFAVIKVALAALHPFTVNIARFLIAGATLAGMLAWEGHHYGTGRHGRGVREAFVAPLRDHLRAVVTLGITGNIFYQTCFILGVNLTAAGSAALIMASTPVWTALMARVGGQERLSARAWLGLGVSLAGTVVVILAGGTTLDLGADTLLGNLLMLAAALFWGLYTVLSKPFMARGASPNGLAFYAVVVALPGMYAFHRFGPGPADWAALGPDVWASLVFSGALSIGVAYGLWNVAVRQVGAAYATAYGNLVPFVAIGAGAWLLDEAITVYQLLGGALIIGGLLLLRRARMTRRPEPVEAAVGEG
ncbi:MAG: DMT family transporter [Bacteroidota bacterium]